MKSDEGFSDMLDKTILIQYQYENVIRFQPKKNSKRAVFTALFFIYLNKKYEIVVTIRTIMTQIERLERNCFSLEFDCKKLGNTNISTPIM